MDEKLSKVFEEKLSDRKEYLEMMAQIRGNNDNLYQKMAQAGETRTGALFADKDNAKAHHQKEQKSPDHHHNNQKDVQNRNRPCRKPRLHRLCTTRYSCWKKSIRKPSPCYDRILS